MKKLKKFAILLTTVCILGTLVGCGNNETTPGIGNSNNTGVADIVEELPIKGKTSTDIAKEYDTVAMASYVDSMFMYTFEYPANVGYIDNGEVEYDSYYSSVVDGYHTVEVTTILGNNSFKIFYPTLYAECYDETYVYTGQYDTAIDFYNNYFKDTYHKIFLLAGNSDTEITSEEHTNTYTFGDLTWEEYSYTFNNHPNVKIYITVKDKIPMIFIFDLLEESNFQSIYAPSEDLWNSIKENQDSIILSIINSIKFSDNKEELLNIKELSVCAYKDSYDAVHIGTQENNLYENIYIPDIRNSSLDGFSYVNDGTVSIDNALDTICSLKEPESGLFMNIGGCAMLGSDASVSIDKVGDTYTLHSNTIGDYQVKYYEVTVTSTGGSSSKELLYTFVTESTYGFIMNGAYHETGRHDLDYALKHMIFKNYDEYRFWKLEDYIVE